MGLELQLEFALNEYISVILRGYSISCDGVRCAFVLAEANSSGSCSQLYGRKFSPAGLWLTNWEVLSTCGYNHGPMSALGAANYLPAPEFRSFMVARADDGDTLSARYRSESGSFIPNPAPIPGSYPTLMASDGTRFLLGYSSLYVTYLVGIDNVAGTTLKSRVNRR